VWQVEADKGMDDDRAIPAFTEAIRLDPNDGKAESLARAKAVTEAQKMAASEENEKNKAKPSE
jgi:hypothetical protein